VVAGIAAPEDRVIKAVAGGSMTVYKNREQLGVVVVGLSGKYS
jgi:hypothetical protein